MAEPQVTAAYPQPAFANQQQRSLPPVNQAYPTQSPVYVPQGTQPQQQTGYAPQQTVQPLLQPGYSQQQKNPPPYGGPPPPYQAAPPHVVLVNTVSQPVPNQVIVRNTQQQPNDYMVYAILTTVFCCLPCGIVAIIKASNVRSHFVSGNYQAANRSSQEAKTWALASFICGAVCDSLLICYLFFWWVFAPLTWYSGYDTDHGTYDPSSDSYSFFYW